MKNQKIVNIRALAIIIVVLGHSIILYSSSSNPFIVVFVNLVVFGIVSFLLGVFIRKTKLKFIIGE